MRVATKVAAGTGGILALLIGVLLYQVSLVRSLASANRDLGAVRIRSAMVSLELLRELGQLEEYTRKFFVTHDAAYAEMVGEARDSFVASLNQLEALRAGGPDAVEVDRLVRDWRRFALAGMPRQQIAPHLAGEDQGQLLEELSAPLDTLQRQALTVIDAIGAAIGAQVRASAAASQEADQVTLAVVGVALGLSVLIMGATVRSINEPLKRLTEATRTVAKGRFSFQIDLPRGDEFARLAEDFNTMVRRLEELDALKRGFVSHVSHELKTPLVAMEETNKLLLEETPGPLTAKQRRLLELNQAGSRRLSAMIANLLDLSRIEAGAMEYDVRPHDLARLAAAAAGLLETHTRERGLAIELDAPAEPVLVACDGDRIIQVISNLLDNAVRFSPPGAAIRASVRRDGASLPASPEAVPSPLAAAPAAYAEVTVEDEGPGVPDAAKERIFERFQQASKSKRRPDGGVGLGLAICREIVEAHGGRVWVADRPGGGSVFTVALPIEPPAAMRRRPQPDRDRAEGGHAR